MSTACQRNAMFGRELLLVICACMTLFSDVFSDTFTALVHLQEAAEAEAAISQQLKDYINIEKNRLQTLESLASRLQDHSRQILNGNGETFISNPVSAYVLIKDMQDMSNKIEHALNNQTSVTGQVLATVAQTLGSKLPGQTDVTGAISAIVRLQDTYNIPAKQLAESALTSPDSANASPVLLGSQCFEIGRTRYILEDYFHAIPWFEAAIQAYEREGDNQSIAISLDYLSFSLYKQGNVKRALLHTNRWLSIEPHHKRAMNNKLNYEAELSGDLDLSNLPNLVNLRPLDGYHNTEDFSDYESLCRGEKTKLNPFASRLSCRYVHNQNPLLLLSPAKEEELVLEPRLVFYHHVFSDNEVELIKSLAKPKLHRSGVFNPDANSHKQQGGLVSETRVSESAWLFDGENQRIAGLTKRVSAIANLDQTYTEGFQVLNYGIGGHYEPHVDWARVQHSHVFGEHEGNRIATFIVYLSDVERGGATVFPKLGAAVWPEKGGAAFWYNLHKDGTGDERTLHGACPVLLGYKWVSNKWFHERGNEFKRPCDLTPPLLTTQ